ncbi:MAG: tetratricopeptide repeat protein [Candidatus Heimdallarchaeota archaeon]
MKRSYILKAILAVFLFFTFLQATVIPAYSWYEHYTVDVPVTKADPPIYVYSDTMILDYEYLYPVSPLPTYDAPYGFTYNFTTSPSCDMTVYAMTARDYSAWRSHESHTKKTLEQDKTSGAGKFRFNDDTRWVIVFWNTDSNTPTTMITFTVTIEKVPPIGLIIGLSAGGVVVIAIIAGTIVSVRRKPDSSKSSGDESDFDYVQTPAVAAPSANDQALFENANSEFQKGNVNQAINMWEQILKNSPEFYPALCNLAMAQISLGNTPKAIECLNQALAIKPDYKPALDLLDIAKTKYSNAKPTNNDSIS